MDFAIVLDNQSPLPLHQQLYDALRQAILTGRCMPRQKLPSTRALAKLLQVSRSTVTQSYDRLFSEGYLETIVGSGTYVCAQLPDDLLHSPASVIPEQAALLESDRSCADPIEPIPLSIVLSGYGHRLQQFPLGLQPTLDAPIDFRYGQPAFQQFPIGLWRKLLARVCRSQTDWLDYARDLQGYQPLRQAIAGYLTRARAVQCHPDQIILTNGTQQGLDLIMRLLIDPGTDMALEDPGYLSARRVFLSHGAKLHPIAVDESGLKVEQLANLPTTPRLVYVTPSHQFPTGAILSLARRLELLAWAAQHHGLIVEDDYDSEYRYGNRPIPALQGLDSQTVIYLGTFSKVLFPSLRIGYLVVPPALVSLFTGAKWLSDRQLPSLEQRALTEFIQGGHLESHIRKMRSHYDRLRQTLVQALQIDLGDRAVIMGAEAGMHVMVKIQHPGRDANLVERAAQVGVGITSAQVHYLHSQDRGEFILGYGGLEESQIVTGIHRLAQVLT
jgi:GntR family transcriptional regulator/MocR family aminotransferase